MSELIVMDETGDTRLQWEKDRADQVKAAEERFHKLRGEGYAAYKVNAKGEQAEVIQHFDPTLEKILFRPPMQGG